MTHSNAYQTKDQHRTPANNGMYIKQLINNNRTTALEQTAAEATGVGGLNALYWRLIFALDFVVVKTQIKYYARMEAS